MALEFDHAYIWVPALEPASETLRRAGFHVWKRHVQHTGSGTSSTIVLFESSYLELLIPDASVSDDECTSEDLKVRATRLAWRENGASPIGVGVRRQASDGETFPFPTYLVRRSWMPHGTVVEHLGSPLDVYAPDVFVAPAAMAMPSPQLLEDAGRQRPELAYDVRSALAQRAGVLRVTGIQLGIADPRGMTPAVHFLSEVAILGAELADSAFLRISLATTRRALCGTSDLRRHLPLILHFSPSSSGQLGV